MAAVPSDAQIPIESLRDLLGLARAVYATLAGMGPAYSDQLFRLRGIGYQLTLALERASQGGPGTFPHRAAWLIAEKAVEDLGALVAEDLPAKALITASGERLLNKPRKKPTR
jgi:hypothetical protein